MPIRASELIRAVERQRSMASEAITTQESISRLFGMIDVDLVAQGVAGLGGIVDPGDLDNLGLGYLAELPDSVTQVIGGFDEDTFKNLAGMGTSELQNIGAVGSAGLDLGTLGVSADWVAAGPTGIDDLIAGTSDFARQLIAGEPWRDNDLAAATFLSWGELIGGHDVGAGYDLATLNSGTYEEKGGEVLIRGSVAGADSIDPEVDEPAVKDWSSFLSAEEWFLLSLYLVITPLLLGIPLSGNAYAAFAYGCQTLAAIGATRTTRTNCT